MKLQDIQTLLSGLKEASQLSFYLEGSRVNNRFDSKNRPEEITPSMKASFTLYALIADLILFKASGKAVAEKKKVIIRNYLAKILKEAPEDLRDNLANEKLKAESIMDDFLFDRQKVSFPMLLSSLAPFIFVRVSQEHDPKVDKKTFQHLYHDREAVFNVAVLYTRSLFKSVLTLDNIDPAQFRIDTEHPENGVIAYKNRLFVPSGRNAFTLDGYKDIARVTLSRVSENFSLKDIDTLALLYLAKSMVVEYRYR